jgi:large subunit ribosomal protein L15
MNLHNLKPNPGAKHRVKRLGCGESSGLGKTSGRGHKGQKSRSGGGVRPGFEGGQMPLHRRLPKRGFNNTRFQDKIAVVNVASLNERFEDGDTVNMGTLKAARLVKGTYDGVKVLGNGDLAKKLTVEGCKVSASAKEKIEKAGGSIVETQQAAE